MPYHLGAWPDSLVSRYVRASSGCDPDYGVMTGLIRDTPFPDSSLGGADTAVVHVRVGDVVEFPDSLGWAVWPCPDDWSVRSYFDGQPVFTDEWRAVLELL